MKKLLYLLAPAITLTALIVVPMTALGQAFVPLTGLPAVQQVSQSADLAAFLNNIYKICVGAAAALAVLQIMRGGMEYMLSDSITEKGHAKHVITMAILGLLLVLSPYIVFSIINPEILDLKIGTERLGTGMDPNGTDDGTGTKNGAGGDESTNGMTEEQLRALSPEACAAAGRSYNEELSLCLKKAKDTSGDELPTCEAGSHVIGTEEGFSCAPDDPPKMVTVPWQGTQKGDVIWAGYVVLPTSDGKTQSGYFHTIYRPQSGTANRNEVMIACQNDSRHGSSRDTITRVECQFVTTQINGREVTRTNGTYEVPEPAIQFVTAFSEVDVPLGS